MSLTLKNLSKKLRLKLKRIQLLLIRRRRSSTRNNNRKEMSKRRKEINKGKSKKRISKRLY